MNSLANWMCGIVCLLSQWLTAQGCLWFCVQCRSIWSAGDPLTFWSATLPTSPPVSCQHWNHKYCSEKELYSFVCLPLSLSLSPSLCLSSCLLYLCIFLLPLWVGCFLSQLLLFCLLVVVVLFLFVLLLCCCCFVGVGHSNTTWQTYLTPKSW